MLLRLIQFIGLILLASPTYALTPNWLKTSSLQGVCSQTPSYFLNARQNVFSKTDPKALKKLVDVNPYDFISRIEFLQRLNWSVTQQLSSSSDITNPEIINETISGRLASNNSAYYTRVSVNLVLSDQRIKDFNPYLQIHLTARRPANLLTHPQAAYEEFKTFANQLSQFSEGKLVKIDRKVLANGEVVFALLITNMPVSGNSIDTLQILTQQIGF